MNFILKMEGETNTSVVLHRVLLPFWKDSTEEVWVLQKNKTKQNPVLLL